MATARMETVVAVARGRRFHPNFPPRLVTQHVPTGACSRGNWLFPRDPKRETARATPESCRASHSRLASIHEAVAPLLHNENLPSKDDPGSRAQAYVPAARADDCRWGK